MPLDRAVLLGDDTRTGAAWCEAYTRHVDDWLTGLFDAAAGADSSGIALVAVGGYGRGELCPESDIDVMLVHAPHPRVSDVADRLWYPIWDEGLHLGHSVCTPKEAAVLAGDDLGTATALLSVRHLAGDERLASALSGRAVEQWRKQARSWLTELGAQVELRHQRAGEVAFALEPDLKEGRGGLRDVHSLRWAAAADRILLDHDEAALADAYHLLLDVRVELQRSTGRASNVLALQDQQTIADALGVDGPDALMGRVAAAARAVAWASDDAWRRIRSSLRGPLGRLARHTRTLADGIELHDGEIRLATDADPAGDPLLALRAAAAAASHSTVIERTSLERLSAESPPLGEPWPVGARESFEALLRTGRPTIAVIEALDQRGIWCRLLPEWEPVRARPQHNGYHRFTVDRHLLETTANAAQLADRVARPDLLVISALLHDIGKGRGGDHTAAGVSLAAPICRRIGLSPEETDVVVSVVANHLLLADVATRRDLDDPATARRVADAVRTHDRLALLAALTEADSIATGPMAWSPWKAQLVEQLVQRVGAALGDAAAAAATGDVFPTEALLSRLGGPGPRVEAEGSRLTVMADDRPGLFSRLAGVLALHGLDVLRAAAHSTDDGRVVDEFHVADPRRSEIPWSRVLVDLDHALAGKLALDARLAERIRTYRRGGSAVATGPRATPPAVHFDNAASERATVVDVHAADGIGVLYRITRALAELDVDIRSAKVQTLGAEVVDAFYVRDRAGAKITDAHHLAEIERAILHALA